MSKKEYCLNNPASAEHNYYKMYIHGIEYGINDYAYISRVYQPQYCGEKRIAFHKVKVNYNYEGDGYVTITDAHYDGTKHKLRLYLRDFWRLNIPLALTEII